MATVRQDYRWHPGRSDGGRTVPFGPGQLVRPCCRDRQQYLYGLHPMGRFDGPCLFGQKWMEDLGNLSFGLPGIMVDPIPGPPHPSNDLTLWETAYTTYYSIRIPSVVSSSVWPCTLFFLRDRSLFSGMRSPIGKGATP